MSNVARLVMSRRLVNAFMARDPLQLSLSRRPRTASAAGGWTLGAEVVLPPQTFRMTPFKRRLGPGETASPDGDVANSQFLLMGVISCDIQKNDRFNLDVTSNFLPGWYLVTRVHPKRLIRTESVVEWQGEDI